MAIYIAGVIVLAVVVVIVSYLFTRAAVQKQNEAYMNDMRMKAQEMLNQSAAEGQILIDKATVEADSIKREALLEAKEESIRTKNELDKEIRERRNEVQRNERRVQQKEETLDRKTEQIERKEQSLTAREESLRKQKEEVTQLQEKRIQELERISGLTSEQAKEHLLKIVEEDVKHDSAIMIKEVEAEAREEADKRAKEIVIGAIQRCAADHVAESTISVVQLPGDEMKGRIMLTRRSRRKVRRRLWKSACTGSIPNLSGFSASFASEPVTARMRSSIPLRSRSCPD